MLRLVNRALDQGHRPGQVVGSSREEIEELLGVARATGRPAPRADKWEPEPIQAPRDQAEVWLDAARNFDAEHLERTFQRAWFTMGALTFLEQYAAKFVRAIGEAWAAEELGVAQEHFASERLRDFLMAQWRPISDRSAGPRVICAGLPGEQHDLGLHMAAVVTAVAGCQVIFLGPNTPLDQIEETAKIVDGVGAVMLSVSEASNPILTRRDLTKLRATLPESCRLVIGGSGAPHNVAGVEAIDSLRELSHWLPKIFSEGAKRIGG